jgi:hypothetical protein
MDAHEIVRREIEIIAEEIDESKRRNADMGSREPSRNRRQCGDHGDGDLLHSLYHSLPQAPRAVGKRIQN